MKAILSIVVILIFSTLIGCQKPTQTEEESLSIPAVAPTSTDEQTSTESVDQAIEAEPEWIACPQRRSEVCAQIYKPVCAPLDTQVRCVTTPCPSQTTKTYSNSCMACVNHNTTGFIAGACKPVSAAK